MRSEATTMTAEFAETGWTAEGQQPIAIAGKKTSGPAAARTAIRAVDVMAVLGVSEDRAAEIVNSTAWKCRSEDASRGEAGRAGSSYRGKPMEAWRDEDRAEYLVDLLADGGFGALVGAPDAYIGLVRRVLAAFAARDGRGPAAAWPARIS
jgi:hypothetical protein